MKKSNAIAIVVALITLCGVVGAAVIGLATPFSEKIADRLDGNRETYLAIRVADDNGQAIIGAKVILFSSSGSLSQYTDSNGVSVFDRVSSGDLRLIVEAQNYQIYEKQIQIDEHSIDVRLSERSPSSVDFILRAVQAANGTPIPGIEMIIVAYDGVYRQTTDSDGFARYTLPVTNENDVVNVQISVDAKGYAIENQISTLVPGRLQYVMLMPDSLTIEIPDIPTPTMDVSSNTSILPSDNIVPDMDTIIGTGVTITQIAGNGLRVEMLGPNEEPWENVYVEVYEQQPDAAGNPSLGDWVKNGQINKQGQLDFELAGGTYIVCPAEMPGYGWTINGCVYNINVVSGQLSVIRFQPGKLEVAISDASGIPWNNVYFEICTQKQDVNGHPVVNDCVGRQTDNAGIGSAWRTPGLYIVKLDLRGYNWGNLTESKGDTNIYVQKGNTTQVVISMGQLSVGLLKPDGDPNANAYVEVYTQKTAINGQPTLDDMVWYGNTDNGGYVTVNLTEGKYALRVGDDILYDIPIEWGKITQSDGKTYQQK